MRFYRTFGQKFSPGPAPKQVASHPYVHQDKTKLSCVYSFFQQSSNTMCYEHLICIVQMIITLHIILIRTLDDSFILFFTRSMQESGKWFKIDFRAEISALSVTN